MPARVAGVAEVVLCVAARSRRRVPTAVLAAAAIAGVDEVYRVGGAQAIAAMAYGTETIRAVDVIVGPGQRLRRLAKREVAGGRSASTAFAGPSEVVVVADDTVDPACVAIDVLVQAEHGPDGLAWLIAGTTRSADAVDAALDALLAAAPRRDEIEATLAAGGRVVLVDDPTQAIEVANAIAPEHLELMCADPDAARPAGAQRRRGVRRAVGAGVDRRLRRRTEPRAADDGTARFASALRVADFQKHIHVVHADAAALARVGPPRASRSPRPKGSTRTPTRSACAEEATS